MKPDTPAQHLAAALGRIPSGIFVLTAADDGRETGMLASWVQQCSFRPPRVSIAVQGGREIVRRLAPGTRFILNILESSQTDMVAHFGKGFAPDEDAFAGLSVEREPGRGAVLAEALAFLECEVVQRVPAGDHDLFIAEVRAGRLLDDGQPMVHIRKNGLHY